jgi:hypothetical protein
MIVNWWCTTIGSSYTVDTGRGELKDIIYLTTIDALRRQMFLCQ